MALIFFFLSFSLRNVKLFPFLCNLSYLASNRIVKLFFFFCFSFCLFLFVYRFISFCFCSVYYVFIYIHPASVLVYGAAALVYFDHRVAVWTRSLRLNPRGDVYTLR